MLLLALVRLGQTGPAGQFLDGLSDADREHGEIGIATAALRLATGDPRAATAAIAPVLDGSAPVAWQNGLAQAYVLEAIARDSLRAQLRPPPTALWNARWTWPNPTACCCPSCCIPRRACSTAGPGTRTAHAASGRRDSWPARRAREAWGDGRGIWGWEPPCRTISSPREQGGPGRSSPRGCQSRC